jgi:hypothetical protein
MLLVATRDPQTATVTSPSRCEGRREAGGALLIMAALFAAPIIAKEISRGRAITD